MNNKGKYIGVESRVQYAILEDAINEYLSNGNLDKEKCLLLIKQFNKGENRSLKILKHITVLIKKNELLLSLGSQNIKKHQFYELSISNRKAMIICMFCNSFPITYDILTVIAQVFKVQNTISKEAIVQKMGAIYGGNRAMHIAITEIIPLLIECGVIKRDKMGIYSRETKLTIYNKYIAELIIYTDIKLSGSKSTLIDDLNHRPWYLYFEISTFNTDNFNLLISKKDSSIGGGYLKI